jgi:hypothetical protein
MVKPAKRIQNRMTKTTKTTSATALPPAILDGLAQTRQLIAKELEAHEAANSERAARSAKLENMQTSLARDEEAVNPEDLKAVATIEARRAQVALLLKRSAKVEAEGLPDSKRLYEVIHAELGRGCMRPLLDMAIAESASALAPLFADAGRVEMLARQTDRVRKIEEFTAMFGGAFYRDQPDGGAAKMITALDKIMAGSADPFVP